MNEETQTDALRHHTQPVPANYTSQTRADITPRSLLIAQSTKPPSFRFPTYRGVPAKSNCNTGHQGPLMEILWAWNLNS